MGLVCLGIPSFLAQQEKKISIPCKPSPTSCNQAPPIDTTDHTRHQRQARGHQRPARPCAWELGAWVTLRAAGGRRAPCSASSPPWCSSATRHPAAGMFPLAFPCRRCLPDLSSQIPRPNPNRRPWRLYARCSSSLQTGRCRPLPAGRRLATLGPRLPCSCRLAPLQPCCLPAWRPAPLAKAIRFDEISVLFFLYGT